MAAKKLTPGQQKEVEKLLKEQAEELKAKLQSEYEDKLIETKRIASGSSFLSDPSFEDDEDVPQGAEPEGYGFGSPEEERKVDVFEHCEQLHTDGKFIKYVVYRNHNFVGELSPPCSWQHVQKEFGGGHFKVIAKDLNNQFVKQTSINVEAPPKVDEPLNLGNQQGSQPQFDFNTLMPQFLQFIQATRENDGREKAREDREEKRSNESMITAITSILSTQKESSSTVFLEMQKMMMENQKNMFTIIQEINSANSKTIEKLDDKMQKQVEAIAKNKRDDMSTLDLIKLLSGAEDKGWEKAEEFTNKIAEAISEKSNEEPEGSNLTKLIGSLGPLFQMQVQQQQMNLQRQAQMQNQPQRRPQARRPHPGQRRPVRRPVQPVGVQNPGPIDESKLGKDSLSDMVDIDPDLMPIQPEIMPDEPAAQEPEANAIEVALQKIYENSSPEQIQIGERALAKIAIVKGSEPGEAAKLVLEDLKQESWTPEQVREHFTFDFMWKVAKTFGVDDNERKWFEDFYAYIENPAGMELEGNAS